VLLWLAATGRDSSVFPDPDRFDLHRTNVDKHMAFGAALHYSLGKLEAPLAVEELIDASPRRRGCAAVQTRRMKGPSAEFDGCAPDAELRARLSGVQSQRGAMEWYTSATHAGTRGSPAVDVLAPAIVRGAFITKHGGLLHCDAMEHVVGASSPFGPRRSQRAKSTDC
jgi:hypothetical protein